MAVARTVMGAVDVAAMDGPGAHVVPVAWSGGSARFPARVFATVGLNGHLARVYAGSGGIGAVTDLHP